MTAEPFNHLQACRHGAMLYNANDLGVGVALRLYGEWCEGEIDLLCKIARPGDVVIDGGAHFGTHTLPLARIVGDRGAVLAFEPQRLVFQALCATVALNSLTNVHCFHAALGATHGTVNVPVCDPRTEASLMTVWLGGASGERVPLLRLDSIDVHSCRLVKMDIEGMEEVALRGASKWIERFSPILYIENDKPEKSASLINYLCTLNYQMFWHRTPLFNPHNFAENQTNVFGTQRSANMLCLRSQRDADALRNITSHLERIP